MSKRDQGGSGNYEEFDDELIKAEFDSMVESLSLDESAPTTYLDKLAAFEDHNRFTPPAIPKRGIKDQIRDAIRAITRWKNNPHNDHPEDGAAL
ncbi:hypothetical protein DLE03_03900 [Actinobacteria bacterium IMCC25003]|nr:hypothetical protein DLE03_03900 [Actinobacteria bacterium IMCC25003]